MFAEQKILELIFQGNKDEAETMLADMYKGELMEFKDNVEWLLDSIKEQLEDRFGFKFED